MNNYNREFGKRICSARKNLGITMKELGKKVGLHESTIQRYESGEIKTLDIEKVREFSLLVKCFYNLFSTYVTIDITSL